MSEVHIGEESLTPNRSLEGEVIGGRYELTRLIGSGGMGQVYRARQLSTGGRVALKVMEVAKRKPSSLDRFRHEAETTARLTHPNTVRILDFGADGDLLFLVMEYLSGSELTQFIRPGGQPNAFVAHMLFQVACSLSEAHSRGVVHRDIKPNNIMLLHHSGLPSFVKVIDFGIARAITGPGHGTVGILGTVGYIAPEHARERISPNARSDLYSLGCVAYEVLTGQLPFEGVTHRSAPLDILEAHIDGVPRPILSLKPDADPELANLVMNLIQRRPDLRPASAGELLVPLQGIRARLMPGLGQSYQVLDPNENLVPPEAQSVPDTLMDQAPAAPAAPLAPEKPGGPREGAQGAARPEEPSGAEAPHPVEAADQEHSDYISFQTEEPTEISGPASLMKAARSEHQAPTLKPRKDAETFKLRALGESAEGLGMFKVVILVAIAFGLGLGLAPWLTP